MNNTNELINELSTNFIEYAAACNSDRAIPDAKSGLKPVAKRILFGMHDNKRTSNKPHVKCARIVGDVMGSLHPHGDSSIYGAMVRLSQPWILRYPLIDFHGNQGSVSGDGPAAYRYTEARLSKLAEDGLLQGLKKKNVDFIPNYDETLEEPVTLPAIFPNLLCNPNEGIGVAMACKWAPHNLKEVAQAINDYIEGKEPMLPGPDFPTGGIVINKDDIPSIMKTGHGSVKIRGKYKIEKNKIIFYEIPYAQTIEGILAEIGKICDEKQIEGITDAHDESNKKGIRIVITCDKKVNPEVIVKKLFLKTNLQSSFSYNQVALVGKTPTELNLKDCIKIYLDHNIDCLKREIKFDIAEADKRLEIVNGLLKALASIDDIIKLIKSSESSAAAKDALISKYQFTEPQAKAILAMRLSSLAKLEGIELNNEKAELETKLKGLNHILNSEKQQIEVIKNRLADLVKKYGDNRKTELAQIEVPKEEKEKNAIVPEDVVVITTKSGLIKRIPAAAFKIQRRGGKGIKSTDDVILNSVKTNTVDLMMFFTTEGKLYKTSVNNIPEGDNKTKGIPISSLVNLAPNEKVIAVTSLHKKTTPKYIIFITKQGKIKKTLLSEYESTRASKSGLKAITLVKGDSIASISFQDDEDLIIATKNCFSFRLSTKEINAMGRVTQGIKGINLKDDDEVIAALPVHKETDTVGVFTTAGLGKRVPLTDFPLLGRGSRGVGIYKNKEEGNIIGIAMLSDEDNLLVSGNKTSICISAKDISIMGRTALGVSIIKDNRVLSISKI